MTEALEMQVKSKVSVKVHTIDVPFLLIQIRIHIHCDRNYMVQSFEGE
jgi:hypothetical protein